jgi:hypothetical protein
LAGNQRKFHWTGRRAASWIAPALAKRFGFQGHKAEFAARNANGMSRTQSKGQVLLEEGMRFGIEFAVYMDSYAAMRRGDAIAVAHGAAELPMEF